MFQGRRSAGDYGADGLTTLLDNNYGASGASSRRVIEPTEPLSVTNAEKLSLSPSTPVGTEVSVSDGFVVSGAGTACNGFYNKRGTSGGKDYYNLVGYPDDSGNASIYWDTDTWYFTTPAGDTAYFSTDDVADAWNITTWQLGGEGRNPQPTLTHPAIQILVAPDSTQGGVAVIGGTQDGVFYKAAASVNGKTAFKFLGQPDDGDDTANAIAWQTNIYSRFGVGPSSEGFAIVNASGSVYYNLSDTPTPPETGWLDGHDATPATITVTSVSVGEINAGLFVANDGATNGSSYVSQPFHGRQYYMGLNGGGSNNMHWDTDFNVWTDDVGVWTTDNVAFPGQGTDNGGGHTGATFARNDVANEVNWQNA